MQLNMEPGEEEVGSVEEQPRKRTREEERAARMAKYAKGAEEERKKMVEGETEEEKLRRDVWAFMTGNEVWKKLVRHRPLNPRVNYDAAIPPLLDEMGKVAEKCKKFLCEFVGEETWQLLWEYVKEGFEDEEVRDFAKEVRETTEDGTCMKTGKRIRRRVLSYWNGEESVVFVNRDQLQWGTAEATLQHAQFELAEFILQNVDFGVLRLCRVKGEEN